LCRAALKFPKSAESPVSLIPKKIFLPLGSSVPASASTAIEKQRIAAASATRTVRIGLT
jgi:hypothetical protein